MPPQRITAREATRSGVPPPAVEQNHTQSSALHPLRFVGRLAQWSNFLRVVEATDKAQIWSHRATKLSQKSCDIDEAVVKVGDETGVQGRFQQNFGTVLGHIFRAQSIDLHFADFKCLETSYSKTPDAIPKSDSQELKVVGKINVP